MEHLESSETGRGAQIAIGFGIGAGLHLVFQGLFFALGSTLVEQGTDPYGLTVLLPLFFIGGSQLVYVLPAVVIAYWRRRPGIGQGLLLLAGLTFLINAACYGVMFFGAA